jgi:hypothetical protein
LAGFLLLVPKSNFLLIILEVVAGILIYVLSLHYTGYIDINQENVDLLKTLRGQS